MHLVNVYSVHLVNVYSSPVLINSDDYVIHGEHSVIGGGASLVGVVVQVCTM